MLVLLSVSLFAQTGEWRETSSFSRHLSVRNAASSLSSLGVELAPGSRAIVNFSPGVDLEKPHSLRFESAAGESWNLPQLPNRWFESNSQFEVLLPDDLPLGEGKVLLSYNEDQQISTDVKIVKQSFVVYGKSFTRFANVQNTSAEGTVQQNGLTTPVRPGNYLTLWGTGLGVEAPRTLYVVIGGQAAKIVWSGKAPDSPGIDQINVFLEPHRNWREGCFIPLRVRANGVDSDPLVISVAKEGACEHPYGFSLEEMQKLDQDGVAPLSRVSMDVVLGPPALGGSNPFYGYDLSREELTWKEGASVNIRDDGFFLPSGTLIPESGSCTTYLSVGILGQAIRVSVSFDAGKSVRLQGQGKDIELTRPPIPPSSLLMQGNYQKSLPEPFPQKDISLLVPPVFREGAWTLKVLGGTDISAFEETFNVAPPLAPTNLKELKLIDRTASLPVRWNPAGYNSNDRILISIGKLSCTARAQDGEFLIPSSELKKVTFDSSQFINAAINLTYIGTPQLFSVPRTNGEEMRGVYEPASTVIIPTTIR